MDLDGAEMNEHILLVEDEEALRAALEVRLHAEGYIVTSPRMARKGCARQLIYLST